MVITGVAKEGAERVMAMGPERSKHLHNFKMPTPWLTWGNQRFLRCMKVNSTANAAATAAAFDHRHHRSSSSSRSFAALETDYPLGSKRNRDFGFDFDTKQRSPSAKRLNMKNSRYIGACDGEDGIEAVRERLMFDLKTAADNMKFSILKEGGDDEDEDVEEEQSTAAAAAAAAAEAERPWNLRTRRAACKAPIVNGKNNTPSTKVEERKASVSPPRTENLMKSSRLRVGGNGGEKKERAKFSVLLSRKEIEEDYLEMLGERPPRRPKKRSKTVQKQMDTLFPGLWLTEVTPDMYKVSELPESGKALRLIKYAVGKSGAEFRREMQRHSVAVRQLFHYKGQLDPLKADALNKAVRDTAHEAVAAIFAAEENKAVAAPSENLNRRIQGFGNTNFEMQTEDKKSFLSEVVDLGSASIKQGLSSFTQAHSLMKNDTGSYKSPNLRRSLTTEIDYRDKYEPAVIHNEKHGSLGVSKNGSSGPWGQESRMTTIGTTNGDSSSSYAESKTREEKLLDTIVTSGGVRLQPTRDAIQIFLGEAAKLDAVTLSLALESKLQSPSWQVRMKAACVLEATLRKKGDEHFSVVATYFGENKDVLLRCSESPQASLREKASKVLSLLDGGQTGSALSHLEKPVKSETTTVVEMPDLIDTGDSNDDYGTENSAKNQNDRNIENLTTSTTPLIDDIFGHSVDSGASTSEQKAVDDPFADVSFHTSEGKEQVDDLFGGITVDRNGATEKHTGANKNGPELFDIFGSSSALPPIQGNHTKDVNDLMSGLSVNESASKLQEIETSKGALSGSIFSETNINPNHQVSNDAKDTIGSQTIGTNVSAAFPMAPMLYNMPPGIMFNQAFPSQTVNYGAMGTFLAQQQFLATMANFQHLGNLNSQNSGEGHPAGTNDGGYSSALPDVFHPNFPTQAPTAMTSNSKKEDTKAFDFISDHLAAARDPKRVA